MSLNSLLLTRRALALPLAFVVAGLFSGCHRSAPEGGGAAAPAAHSVPQIYVANYPLEYFTKRIGGHVVNVVYDAPKDIDPAFWNPTDKQIAGFQQADLIILNGATYSKWAQKVSLPEDKVVDTSAGFKDKFIEIKNAVTHSHGKQGMHSHNGTAFTTWVDFDQARQQAEAICTALQKLMPDQIELFALNYDSLKNDLMALDRRMKAVGKTLAGRPIAASHPVYHYWARRYGINLKFVLWEPEEVPTDAQMEELKKLLVDHPAQWFVWEGDPVKESVEKIKTLGLSSVVFDPCANTPDKGDWLSVMDDNVKGMEAIK